MFNKKFNKCFTKGFNKGKIDVLKQHLFLI